MKYQYQHNRRRRSGEISKIGENIINVSSSAENNGNGENNRISVMGRKHRHENNGNVQASGEI
jgi:hypothetical protein